MVRFSLNIKTCCLYVTWKIQDHIWAKIFCIPKNMHSRTPMKQLTRVNIINRMDTTQCCKVIEHGIPRQTTAYASRVRGIRFHAVSCMRTIQVDSLQNKLYGNMHSLKYYTSKWCKSKECTACLFLFTLQRTACHFSEVHTGDAIYFMHNPPMLGATAKVEVDDQ